MSLSPPGSGAAGSLVSLSRRNSTLALLQQDHDHDHHSSVELDLAQDDAANFGEGEWNVDIRRSGLSVDANGDCDPGESDTEAKAPSITISVSGTSETRLLLTQAGEESNCDHSQNIAKTALLLPTASSLASTIAPTISVESPNSYISNLSTGKRRASIAVWSDDRLMRVALNATQRASEKPKQNVALTFIRNSLEIAFNDIDDTASSDSFLSSVEESDMLILAPFPNFITRMIFAHFNFKELYRLRRINSRVAMFLQENDNKFFENLDLSPWHKIVNDSLLQTVLGFCGHCVKKLSLRNCWNVTDKGTGYISKLVPLLEEINLASVWEITDTGIAILTRIATNLHTLDLSNCGKLTDSAILAILTFVPHLRAIHLSYCKNLSDASMEHETWSTVRSINMQRCTALSDAGFACWEATARTFALSELILADCSFLTNATVSSIASVCPALEVLSLSFCCALTEACIPVLTSGCPSLRVLDLSFCGSAVSDNSMLMLAGFSPTEVGDDFIAAGDEASALSPPDVRDLASPASRRMQHLESLSLRGCVLLTDVGVAALAALPRLALLNITQCRNVSPAAAAAAARARRWTLLSGGTLFNDGPLRATAAGGRERASTT
ncbi:hypothetical protein HDU83_004772 [Entophlyctis luteolus]|nr:hypothetical protein HDU83_004772 [Entophlyctis luteolus]